MSDGTNKPAEQNDPATPVAGEARPRGAVRAGAGAMPAGAVATAAKSPEGETAPVSNGAQHEEARTSPPRRFGRRLLVAAQLIVAIPATAVLVMSLVALAGQAAWWLDLLAHFRVCYAILLGAAALVQVVVGPRWLAGAWLGGFIINGAFVAPVLLAGAPTATGPALVVVHANLDQENADVAALADWARGGGAGGGGDGGGGGGGGGGRSGGGGGGGGGADVVMLQEVTPENLPRLEAAFAGYRLLAAEPRPDTQGVAVFVRDGLDAEASITRIPATHERPVVQCYLDLAGTPVAILGFHTTRPTYPTGRRYQDEALAAAGVWSISLQAVGTETLLIGDVNSTRWGAPVVRLRQQAGLIDASTGHGLAGTWPAHLPAPLRLDINQTLHSNGLVCTEFTVGPNTGGDHRPVRVELRVRR